MFGATSAEQTEASLLLLTVHDRIDLLAAVREPVDSPVPVPARGDDEAVRTAVDTVRTSSPPVGRMVKLTGRRGPLSWPVLVSDQRLVARGENVSAGRASLRPAARAFR